MAKPPPNSQTLRCHACGIILAPDSEICPRCKVARKGDANRPMIAAYLFFVLLMIVAGTITIIYLRSVTHVQ